MNLLKLLDSYVFWFKLLAVFAGALLFESVVNAIDWIVR